MITKMKPPERGRLAAWRSSSTARRCSPAPPGRASPRSAAGSSRTTGSRPSSPCPTSSSTTPASPPTSGSSPTARPRAARQGPARRRPRATSRRCARASARSARRSPTSRSTRSPASTATSPRASRSRSSPTRRSASCASPSSGRCGCAGRSPTTRSPPSLPAKPIQKLRADDAGRAWRELLEDAPRARRFATEKDLAKALSSDLAELPASPSPAQKAVWAGLAVRDEDAPVITDRKGNPEPDPELRDNENVPLPPVPVTFEEDPTDRLGSAGVPRRRSTTTCATRCCRTSPTPGSTTTETKIGYEIPLTRHFYKYVPPRPLEEIDAEIKALEDEIQRLLAEVPDERVTCPASASRTIALRRSMPTSVVDALLRSRHVHHHVGHASTHSDLDRGLSADIADELCRERQSLGRRSLSDTSCAIVTVATCGLRPWLRHGLGVVCVLHATVAWLDLVRCPMRSQVATRPMLAGPWLCRTSRTMSVNCRDRLSRTPSIALPPLPTQQGHRRLPRPRDGADRCSDRGEAADGRSC